MKKKNNLFDKISKINNPEDAISEDTMNILNLDETDLDEVDFEEEESEFADAFDVEGKIQDDLTDPSDEINSFDTKEIELIGSNVVDEAIASMEDYSVGSADEETVDEATDFIEGEPAGDILYDENGFRIETDEDGNELYFDEDGNRAVYDENGDYTLYNPDGFRIDYDEDGVMRLYDAKDREVVYNDEGEIVFASAVTASQDLEFTDLDDEDDYEEESDEDDGEEEEEKTGFLEKIKGFFSNLGPAEYGIGAGALLILIVGIVVIAATVNSSKIKAENMLANVGAQYASLKVTDANTLQAIASKAYMSTATVEEPEEEEDVECNEVKLTYTSIDKDLRIKFYNTANDKLVRDIEFEVKLTHKTDGDVYEFKDENKDGIIYESDLKAGDYTVEVTGIDGISFIFESDYATVKGEIEYVVIDVADEVIENATGVEDTAVKEVEEETPTITDTVEWVESTRTSLDGTDGYKKIDKSDIKSPESSKLETDVFNEVLVAYNPYSICMASGYVKVATLTRDQGDPATTDPSSDPESSPDPSTEPAESPSPDPSPEPSTNPDPTPSASPSESPSPSPSVSPSADVTVTVSKTSLTLKVAGTETLTATVKNADGSTKSGATVTWSSSDSTVATVDTTGKVTAVKVGTCNITATSEGKTATCALTVEAADVTVSSVKLSQETKLTINKNYTGKLTVTITYSDGTTSTDASKCTWASSDTKICTVDAQGSIKALKAGNCKITATCGGKSAECPVMVPGVVSITVSPSSVDVNVGKTATLTVTATMADGTKVTDASKFKWSTVPSNTTAFTVSNAGVVTGKVASDKSPGSVQVYYNGSDYPDSSLTATVTVNVKKDYSSDTTSPLKTNDGKQVYVKDGNGYRTATFSDYYSATDFYIVYNTSYKYTGWQNIDGNTYFFDKDGNKVTGSQVISGVKYEFTSEGVLKTDTSGILGIDVSVWQGNINWTSVKNSGINFAIIRYGYRGSTAGGIYKDTKFDTNISGAKAAGLKVGMYFFTQAITEAEAVEEASACIAAAKEYGISYPIFIDTESGGAGARAENLSVAQRTAVCKAFCQTVKNSGYSAGVYASKWWFGAKLNYSELNGYVIWLAQYASAPSLNGRYDLWQYSSKGSVGGISGNVDMDISYMGY